MDGYCQKYVYTTLTACIHGFYFHSCSSELSYALPYAQVRKTALRFVCMRAWTESRACRRDVTRAGHGGKWMELTNSNRPDAAGSDSAPQVKHGMCSFRNHLTLSIITLQRHQSLCLDIDLKATCVINNAQVLGSKACRFSARSHRFELVFLAKTSSRIQKCSQPSLLDSYSHKKQTYSTSVTRL